MPRHHDHRQPDAQLSQLLLEIEPADARKSHIEHKAARTILRPGIQELSDRTIGSRFKPHRSEKAIKRSAQRVIVIDDVNNSSDVRPVWHPFT